MLASITLAVDVQPAAAEIYRPWCVQYGGLFGAALLLVRVLPQTSRAQSKDRVGVVERLQGDVSIVHFGNSAKATQGMAISLKDQLVTAADARLQIMLAHDTQITLGENAKAAIKEYHFSPFSSGNRGVVLVEVSKGAFLFTTGRISQPPTSGSRRRTVFANRAKSRAEGRTEISRARHDDTCYDRATYPDSSDDHQPEQRAAGDERQFLADHRHGRTENGQDRCAASEGSGDLSRLARIPLFPRG